MPAMYVDVFLSSCFGRLCWSVRRRASTVGTSVRPRAGTGICPDDAGWSGRPDGHGALSGVPAFVDRYLVHKGGSAGGGGSSADGWGCESRRTFTQIGGTFARDGADAICPVKVAGAVATTGSLSKTLGSVKEAH